MLRVAQRKNVRLRIGFWGGPGSGKTMSALKTAFGLTGDWSQIAVIDSEGHRAEMYSHLGPFLHFPIEAPFTPEKYCEAIFQCQFAKEDADGNPIKIKVIIVDSISHEWEGNGGCLEMLEDAQKIVKNKMSPWSVITPRHLRFVESIKQSTCHMLLTARSKIDHFVIMEETKKKAIMEKIPTKIITREGMEYEMTIAFTLYQNHYAEIDKDNTDLFSGVPPFLITEETGMKIRAWNEQGAVRQKTSVIKKETSPMLEVISDLIGKQTRGYKDENELMAIYSELGVTNRDGLFQTDAPAQREMLEYLLARPLKPKTPIQEVQLQIL